MPSVPEIASLESAIELAQRGELSSAERMLREILQRDPVQARAHNALGVVQMQLGRHAESEVTLIRAAQLAPDDARIRMNLGKLYGLQHRGSEAEENLRDAIRLAPANGDAHFGLGVLLKDMGRIAEAEACFREALALAPDDAQAHYALARVHLESGRFGLAEASYRDAIRLWPDFAVARNDLALILLETGRLAAAEESCREAIRIEPAFLRAWSNRVMCRQYDPTATDAEILASAREAGQALQVAANKFRPDVSPACRTRSMLDVGIVSADLHHHPVGLLLLPVLRELKAMGVRVKLYSSGSVVDELSEELAKHAAWTRISDLADEQAWACIRRDRPEVLIDLGGHTGNNRLAIFAARAAPVQVSWLGYFATTGTPNMDYILMDPWHAPDGVESQFTEHVLRMPHTRFCFQPIDAAPPVASRPTSAGRTVFGSFNNIAKVNEQVVQAWSRVLHGVPGSRLVLKWRTLALPDCRNLLAGWFRRAGIDPGRLEFRGESTHGALLGEYGDIDIALDPFPFTGGQTSFEAMWMGVPVVTFAGRRPVSRQTLCMLGNLGLEDLAGDSVESFVERAVDLAHDPDRLCQLRATLRSSMLASPLMDAPAFARAFMNILRDIADRAV